MSRQLRRAIETAAATLADAGIGSARTDAELLAAHIAGTDRGRLALAGDPGPGFFDRYREAIAARATRMPLQHITGSVAFGPVQLQVGPGVFIPRPETEALLEWSMARALGPHPVIVDLCTGSGALAAALASWRTDAQVIAVDDDAAALHYARLNTESLPVRLVHGDVTEPGFLPELDGIVDLVVANPPYIPDGEPPEPLEPEVSEHDPAHALFAGPDGMAVITPIVGHAARWLKAGGSLAIEHDDTTSEATVRAVAAAGAFDAVTAHRDLTGRLRFVTARRTDSADSEGRR